MATKSLKTAYIRALRKHRDDIIEVLFNPAEYSIEKGNTFQSTSLPGLATPVTQFVTGNADTLTMELYFDTYAKSSRHGTVTQREDVRNYTRKIANLMEIDPDLHAPPICEFTWGPPLGSPEGFQFTGIIEKVSQRFTYFLDDGTPVRATLNVTFKEYKTVREQLEQIDMHSADRTKRREFKEGDTLWFFAHEEYGDPALWRVIADHNGLENPRVIAPGTALELPPIAMKTFEQLEPAHHDFYVPAYQILVDGEDLLRKKYLEIASVQVDNTLKGADHFSFTVNSDFNFERRTFNHLTDLFAFGNSVEIYMGYKDAEKLMLRGKVTAVQTSFPATGLPQINVSGYDLSYCMTIGEGKEPSNWPNKKDSEIVAELAKLYGLTSKYVEDTKVKHPITDRGQGTDMQFLERLGVRNGFELYTVDQDLYFLPPKDIRESAAKGNPVVSLEWGKGLLSFSPELNISQQITKVEVRGWDVNTKQEIVGTAGKGEEPRRASGRRSGGELMQAVCRSGAELKIRIPVSSKQDAERWAEAILKKRAELFVQGSGESIGLPEIHPDQNIELLGLGEQLSDIYYVEQATHTINSSGYRTTFKVRDTTI